MTLFEDMPQRVKTRSVGGDLETNMVGSGLVGW